MRDVDTFLELVRDELGLPFTAAELDKRFDELESWDSVHLLRFVGVLEDELGHPVSVPAIVEASSLREVYDLVAAA